MSTCWHANGHAGVCHHAHQCQIFQLFRKCYGMLKSKLDKNWQRYIEIVDSKINVLRTQLHLSIIIIQFSRKKILFFNIIKFQIPWASWPLWIFWLLRCWWLAWPSSFLSFQNRRRTTKNLFSFLSTETVCFFSCRAQ